jgi:dTDP-4-dehydrorhamnose reductase
MPIRIAVTGLQGQVARALAEAGPLFNVEIINLGRPQLDLAFAETVEPALKSAQPDIVVNAAAYTAVDQAETEQDIAFLVNGAGAGAVARAAQSLGLPLIHLSTDYVFDGSKTTPYLEEDSVAPTCVYGASKLAGEHAVAAASDIYTILRTSWVYAPFGKNFVRTIFALARTRPELRVVADQYGCPTYAPDIAAAIIAVAQNILQHRDNRLLLGTFHLAGSEETSWAGFAAAIIGFLAEKGLCHSLVTPITSAEYPTAARRPANSRLDCAKLARLYGIKLPSWRVSLTLCLERLTNEFQHPQP